MATFLDTLNRIADLIRTDPGLAVNASAADIEAGAQAAEAINGLIAEAITALSLNEDGQISPDDVLAISSYIHSDADRLATFTAAHGDDAGRVETGFHLVQNDGGALRFQGKNLINTVIDAIYHIGFANDGTRFVNEDGKANEKVADIAGWLNHFLSGDNIKFGTDGNDVLRSGDYSNPLSDAANELFLAGAGNDKVIAKEGDDTVDAGAGDDRVVLGEGNDVAFGGTGHDRIWGQEGNDAIDGGDGNDKLGGGTGDDTLMGGDGMDRAWGGEGNDVIDGGDGDDRLSGQDGDDDITGGEGDDRASGGDGNDKISGDAGNDRLWGHDGDDTLDGGDGHDRLGGHDGDDDMSGGAGNDKLWGGDGNDTVDGGTGDDTLAGHDGDDILTAGDGHDRAWGGEGDDQIDGGDGNDKLGGHDGNDMILGGAGYDKLYGHDGDDVLIGGMDEDTISGGDGNDEIIGGHDGDKLYGGAGEDLIDGGIGRDHIHAGEGSDTILGGAEADHIRLWDRDDERDVVIFNQGDSGVDDGQIDFVKGFASGEDLISLTDFGTLTYIGMANFTGGHEAVRFANNKLEIDSDGDGTADFKVNISGNKHLMRHDFELDNQLKSRFGNDTVVGTDEYDSIISRSDAGEVTIAQDPDAPLYFADQPYEDADDILTGGGGADDFVFQVDINATEEIVRKHTKDNGMINWAGVAGENDNLHDHWVDGIGDDTITDFSLDEGDQIQLIGHTVAVGAVEHLDSDNDGVDDFTLITVISDQGGNGGAHDQDVLGTITVQGDLVQEEDIIVNAAPHFGVVHTLDQWLDMFA